MRSVWWAFEIWLSISIHLSLVIVTTLVQGSPSFPLSILLVWRMGLWPRVIPISIVPHDHGHMTPAGLIRANLRTLAEANWKTKTHTHFFFFLSLSAELETERLSWSYPPRREPIWVWRQQRSNNWVMCRRDWVFLTLSEIWIKLCLNPAIPLWPFSRSI